MFSTRFETIGIGEQLAMEAEDHDESSESSTALSAGGQKFMAFEGLLNYRPSILSTSIQS